MKRLGFGARHANLLCVEKVCSYHVTCHNVYMQLGLISVTETWASEERISREVVLEQANYWGNLWAGVLYTDPATQWGLLINTTQRQQGLSEHFSHDMPVVELFLPSTIKSLTSGNCHYETEKREEITITRHFRWKWQFPEFSVWLLPWACSQPCSNNDDSWTWLYPCNKTEIVLILFVSI